MLVVDPGSPVRYKARADVQLDERGLVATTGWRNAPYVTLAPKDMAAVTVTKTLKGPNSSFAPIGGSIVRIETTSSNGGDEKIVGIVVPDKEAEMWRAAIDVLCTI